MGNLSCKGENNNDIDDYLSSKIFWRLINNLIEHHKPMMKFEKENYEVAK